MGRLGNEYHREYNLRRYRTIRKAAVEHLGGKCVQCGSTNDLQIDHKDPSTKRFDFGRCLNYSKSEQVAELGKCQLLCASCHSDKTISDLGNTKAKGTHGTLSAARYCKPMCDLCRRAWNEYNKNWKRRKRAK